LAQISVSINIVNRIERSLTLTGDTTLSQVRAGFENHLSSLDDTLLLVSYRLSQPESALYELGVRTGDIFTLAMDDTPVHGLGVHVLRPAADVLEVSDNATVGDIQRHLSRYLQRSASQLYVGRYVSSLAHTLADLSLADGDLISLAVLPTYTDHGLVLVPARGGYTPFRVRETSAVMGGPDETIDISHILPRRKRHLIQGAQAEFVRRDDVWHVQALPTANLPLFVDGHRLFPHRPKSLFENNVISLGSNPNEPLLQLVVQFDVE
jgi:hypothetical protein